jgi:transcriptional regulator with XRE-family HTH domain
MEKEQSNRIKEFRLFTGLNIEKLCVALGVNAKAWQAWENGENVPLTVWLKIVKYVMTQRLFFTSSTALSSESADIIDQLDENTVTIKDSALALLNSDDKELKATGRVIMDNIDSIQKKLPKLYR